MSNKAQIVFVRRYFEDEARPIGCGRRLVFAKIGRKWVRVLDPYTRLVAILPREGRGEKIGWFDITQTCDQPSEIAMRYAQDVLRRLAEKYGPPLTRFEQECAALKTMRPEDNDDANSNERSENAKS